MSREIKRVSLDFDWPFDKIWEGFKNPHFKKCPWCSAGYRGEYWGLEDFMRALGSAAEASERRPENYVPREMSLHQRKKNQLLAAYTSKVCRWPWPERPLVESLLEIAGLPEEWATEVERETILLLAQYKDLEDYYENQYLPEAGNSGYPSPSLTGYGIGDVGPKFVELVEALGYKRGLLGDWGSFWPAMKKMFGMFGIPEGWDVINHDGEQQIGACKACKGSNVRPDKWEAYNSWESYEPPEGSGYQVWETVSEGSPVSPVFEASEGLVQWLLSQGYSEKAAKGFIKSEWTPSWVITQEGERLRNIEACREQVDE